MKPFIFLIATFLSGVVSAQVKTNAGNIDTGLVAKGRFVTAQDIAAIILPLVNSNYSYALGIETRRQNDIAGLTAAFGGYMDTATGGAAIRIMNTGFSNRYTKTDIDNMLLQRTNYNATAYASISALALLSNQLSASAVTQQATRFADSAYAAQQLSAGLLGKASTATVAGNTSSINALQAGKLDITTAAALYQPKSNYLLPTDTTGKWASTAQMAVINNTLPAKVDTSKMIKVYNNSGRSYSTKEYFARLESGFADGYTIDYSAAGFTNKPAVFVTMTTPLGVTAVYNAGIIASNTATSAVLFLVSRTVNTLTGAFVNTPVTAPPAGSVLNIWVKGD